jgi:hypothetical protein
MRYELIKAFLGPLQRFFDNPMAYATPGCFWHMQPDGGDSDRAVRLGALTGALARAGLSRRLEPQEWRKSLNDLNRRPGGHGTAFGG